MALINCPECNREVSDKAVTCPTCGCPINLNSSVNATNGINSGSNKYVHLVELPTPMYVEKMKMIPNYYGIYLRGTVPQLASKIGKKMYLYAYQDFLVFGEGKSVKGEGGWLYDFALSYEQMIDIRVEYLGIGKKTLMGMMPTGALVALGSDKRDCKLIIKYWDIKGQCENSLEFQDGRTSEGARVNINGDMLQQLIFKQKGLIEGFSRVMTEEESNRLVTLMAEELGRLPITSLNKMCTFFTMSVWKAKPEKYGQTMPLLNFNNDFSICAEGIYLKKEMIPFDKIETISSNDKKINITFVNRKGKIVTDCLTTPKCKKEEVMMLSDCFYKLICIVTEG